MAVFVLQQLPSSSSCLIASTSLAFHGKWHQRITVRCSAISSTEAPPNLEKEPHKFFDQVTIIVRSGDGGDGALLKLPQPLTKQERKALPREKRPGSLRRGPDGELILPVGGQGGDVAIVADASADTLIPFHKQKRYNAKAGSNVSAMGYLTPFLSCASPAPTLTIRVPVGTVVKQKKGPKLIADLTQAGDRALVAHGGRGGISMVEIPKSQLKLKKTIDAPIYSGPSDKALIRGVPGEEIVLELTLRVVADVGLVGLPNAGKSSLLAAISVAKPNIQPYPFTTLMPNLGKINGHPSQQDGGYGAGATVADLPGLIKDAHLGKGLGRMFLRHLGRTRLIVHVVDASSEDPISDYKTLRKEIRLYNPEYLQRPHIVVLNKLDLPEASERFQSIREEIMKIGSTSSENGDSERAKSVFASAVVGISALKHEGIEEMLKEVRSALQVIDEAQDDVLVSNL